METEIYPGDSVLVWDPLKEKFRKGIVLMRYGYVSTFMMKALGWSYKTAQYPDCIDVQFSDRTSKGHFTDGIKKLI
jgi:hypothetical protein